MSETLIAFIMWCISEPLCSTVLLGFAIYCNMGGMHHICCNTTETIQKPLFLSGLKKWLCVHLGMGDVLMGKREARNVSVELSGWVTQGSLENECRHWKISNPDWTLGNSLTSISYHKVAASWFRVQVLKNRRSFKLNLALIHSYFPISVWQVQWKSSMVFFSIYKTTRKSSQPLLPVSVSEFARPQWQTDGFLEVSGSVAPVLPEASPTAFSSGPFPLGGLGDWFFSNSFSGTLPMYLCMEKWQRDRLSPFWSASSQAFHREMTSSFHLSLLLSLSFFACCYDGL